MAATASVEKGCLRAPYLEGFVHSLANRLQAREAVGASLSQRSPTALQEMEGLGD